MLHRLAETCTGVQRHRFANTWCGDDQHFAGDWYTSGTAWGEDDDFDNCYNCDWRIDDCDKGMEYCIFGSFLSSILLKGSYRISSWRWHLWLWTGGRIHFASSRQMINFVQNLRQLWQDLLQPPDSTSKMKISSWQQMWADPLFADACILMPSSSFGNISGNCFPLQAAHSQCLQIWP